MIDTETLAALHEAMRDIGVRKGEFTLFGLFMRSDAPGTWDLVVSAPWLEAGCWRIQVDTYEPEWDRYGGQFGMALSEEVFCADSRAVLEILPLLHASGDPDVRWQAGLIGIDRFLRDFGLDLTSRISMMRRLSSEASQRSESEQPTVARKLFRRFRDYRPQIEALFQETNASPAIATWNPAHQTSPWVIGYS